MSNNVYFLTAHSGGAKVRARLKEIIPDEGDIFELKGDEWMVRHEAGAEDLAERAGIRGGDERIGIGLVLSVTTYSGRASTALWDWLKAKGF